MRCTELQDLLVAYSADELVPAQREFISLHLNECPSCRRSLAELDLTRRQLDTLRFESYQPQLTGRVMREVEQFRTRDAVRRWSRLGARLLLRATAAAVVAVALVAVLQGRPLGSLFTAPAAPPAGTTAYVLTERHLLQIDAGRASETALTSITPGLNQVVGAAGGRFLLNDGALYAFGPSLAAPRLIAHVDGRLFGASPDGRWVWLLRDIASTSFAVDAIDVATGELHPDTLPKPGTATGGVVSPDGRHLFVIAAVGGETYLKVIDTQTRVREQAFHLIGFDVSATPVGGLDHGQVYVVGTDRLAIVATGDVDESVVIHEVPGLTAAAALSPDGHTLAAARAGGGLLLLDPAGARTLARSKGQVYTHVAWSGTGEWLYAATGHTIDVVASDGLSRTGRIALPAGESPTGMIGR